MGGKEREIRAAVGEDPIFASPPIIHESSQNHWFVLQEVPLHEITVTQLFPVHLPHLPTDIQTHFQGSGSGSKVVVWRRQEDRFY